MEQRLGVRLFNRTTRTLRLTEGGQVFLARCEEILTDIDKAEEALTEYGQIPKGVLRINSSSGFAKHQLIPLIPELQRRYPQLEINLQLTGQAVDLVAEGVDLAIRLGTLQDTNLVARKLAESRRIICASPDYIAAYGTPEIPSDLKRHNCLRLSTSDQFNHWRLTASDTKDINGLFVTNDTNEKKEDCFGTDRTEVIEAKGSFVTDNVDALHELVLQGGGIARLSAFMVGKDIQAGRLIPLLENHNKEIQLIHAIYPHRNYLPVKVRVFIDFLLEAFTPTTPW